MPLLNTYQRVVWSSDNFIAIEIIGFIMNLSVKHSGYRKDQREEPDQGNVEGVSPRSWNHAFFAGKVPLAVLHKQMEREEQDGQRQEEQKAIVGKLVHNTIDASKVPSVSDDLRVQSEWNTETRQKDVPDWQVDEQVVTCGSGTLRAQTCYNEEQVAKNGNHNGDHI